MFHYITSSETSPGIYAMLNIQTLLVSAISKKILQKVSALETVSKTISYYG